MRVTGRIVRFDGVRGYGFITPDIGGEDVFLHVNDLEVEKNRVVRGARVSFEIDEGNRGKFAREVRLSNVSAPVDDDPSVAGDEYFDVLSPEEFRQTITEKLLHITPALNAQQILAVRSSFEEVARKHGLVDS
ncbi:MULTISPECIES: cold shock domain-containing protein [Mycobacterium]|uniref:DNA-binding protein n=1 Tax=Mycobacterium gordonae TaxID=1778 RepID=A0A1A6B8C6_MYCGO|nr:MULTISPECIES: cold shock domain-containing protein [Mycobacterium]MBI2699026.1 cold shock domain-containing protein [Mycobacterium sp.]MBX9980065.1 cold shock domain-containing protein [Mycobacterium gordonae]MCQ4363080.1 cold shock domain-containing protein [Mycobacterium gordonae]MCV7009799.1 cold shock domain-containing protein [Mycobacterium gordonae]OBR98601.1 DNA-binding protein [Mycobacterium gordonae]